MNSTGQKNSQTDAYIITFTYCCTGILSILLGLLYTCSSMKSKSKRDWQTKWSIDWLIDCDVEFFHAERQCPTPRRSTNTLVRQHIGRNDQDTSYQDSDNLPPAYQLTQESSFHSLPAPDRDRSVLDRKNQTSAGCQCIETREFLHYQQLTPW